MVDLFSKWRSGLSRTSKSAFGRLANLLGATEITQETWDELEALRRKAEAPCDKHEGGNCDCGKNKKTEPKK